MIFEKVNEIILPKRTPVDPLSIFDDASIEETGLSRMVLSRTSADNKKPIRAISVWRVRASLDAYGLVWQMVEDGMIPITIWQLLPLAFLEDFVFFNSIFATGSTVVNESIPALFLAKTLRVARESETTVKKDDREYRKFINLRRSGRWIISDFVNVNTSKGILVASKLS